MKFDFETIAAKSVLPMIVVDDRNEPVECFYVSSMSGGKNFIQGHPKYIFVSHEAEHGHTLAEYEFKGIIGKAGETNNVN